MNTPSPALLIPKSSIADFGMQTADYEKLKILISNPESLSS
jgi:hypothetical protein